MLPKTRKEKKVKKRMKIEASSHHECRAWTVFGKKGEGWWKFSNCFYAFAHLVLRKFSFALSLLRVKLWNGSTHENQYGSKYVCSLLFKNMYAFHVIWNASSTALASRMSGTFGELEMVYNFIDFDFHTRAHYIASLHWCKMWVEELYKIMIFILLILCLFLGSSNSLVVNVGHPI